MLNANNVTICAVFFFRPRYRTFVKPNCCLSTLNGCSTFARTPALRRSTSFEQTPALALQIELSALAWAHGDVSLGPLGLRPFVDAQVASVSEDRCLFAMKQCTRLRDVADIGCRRLVTWQSESQSSSIDAASRVLFNSPRRMKRTRQEKVSSAAHVVPLPRQAVDILRELQPLTGYGRYLFPSPRTGERPMSDNGVLSALRRMGFPSDEMTGNGFRAMARTLLAERLHVDEDAVMARSWRTAGSRRALAADGRGARTPARE